MLDNLIYCLNATVPIFLMMLLGMLFRRMGFFDQAFADKLNSYVFKIGLPVMLLSSSPPPSACSGKTAPSGGSLSRWATAAASPCWVPPSWRTCTATPGRPAW